MSYPSYFSLTLFCTLTFLFAAAFLSLRSRFFVFAAYLWFFQIFAILSNLYIESGKFIIEQGVYGFQTGAALKLLGFNVLFFLCFFLIAELWGQKLIVNFQLIRRINWVFWAVLAVVLACLVALYGNLVLSGGIPLLTAGVDRFNFWSQYARFPVIAQILGDLTVIIAMALGACFNLLLKLPRSLNKRFWIRTVAALFALYLLYLLLLGHKFSGQFLAIIFFFLPAFVTHLRQGFLRKYAWALALAAFALFFLIFLNYRDSDLARYAGGPLQAIYYRAVGLQGHVWWGTDLAVSRGEQSLEPFQDLSQGMLTLMYLVGNSSVQSYIDRGVRFTMGYPAIGLYAFGVQGLLLLQIVLAALLATLVSYLYSLCFKLSLLRLTLSLQVLLWAYTSYGTGDFSILFSYKSLVFIVALAVFELLQRAKFSLKTAARLSLDKGL